MDPSMIMKYHNYKLQTHLQHREEEPQDKFTVTRHLKDNKRNQLSLPRQDDCKTRQDIKTNTEHSQSMGGT